MAKNRRTQSGAVRFGPALKTILLCTLLGASGVGYVLQKNKIYELGRQIHQREAILERLRHNNNIHAANLRAMQNPINVGKRVKEQNLGLVQPPTSQIVWLPEPQPAPTNPAPLMVSTK